MRPWIGAGTSPVKVDVELDAAGLLPDVRLPIPGSSRVDLCVYERRARALGIAGAVIATPVSAVLDLVGGLFVLGFLSALDDD